MLHNCNIDRVIKRVYVLVAYFFTACKLLKKKHYFCAPLIKRNMSTITTSTNFSEKWKVETSQQKLFTGDQVIDAYLTGKREGLQIAQKVFLDQLKNNLDKSGEKVTDLLHHLNARDIHNNEAFLKINSWNYLTILISVKEEDFFKESFLPVYDFVEELEEDLNTDTCTVNFSFVDYQEEINDYVLHCDGFVLKLNTD